MKKISIYSNANISNETVKTLYDFFGFDDIVIFSSSPYNIDDPSIAVLPSYFMTFYDGIVVFTSDSDIKKYISTLKTKNIFLMTSNSIINIDTKEMKHELRQSV